MTTFAEDNELQNLISKAQVLMEALPYIQRFHGATVVIKYGGHAMIDPKLKNMVMQDVVLMESIGIKPVIVHGGGPEITTLMDRVGLAPQFIDGQRVTDAETIDIAEMVLAGKLNGEIVSRLNQIGGRAVGLSGKDANMIIARKLEIEGDRDLGFVGEVEEINPEVIKLLDSANFTPVISPIGVDREGQTYNINADTVAAEIAIALKATKLILLTDIRGICRDPKDVSTLIHRIAADQVEELVESGVVRGGMIPKVRACAAAIGAGVGSVHILDGRLPHSLLIEMFTDMGIGTMIHA